MLPAEKGVFGQKHSLAHIHATHPGSLQWPTVWKCRLAEHNHGDFDVH